MVTERVELLAGRSGAGADRSWLSGQYRPTTVLPFHPSVFLLRDSS